MVAQSPAVLALDQSRAGSLWIGTRHGLVRFDGQRMSSIDLGDSGPSEVSVTRIIEAADGVVWATTGRQGLLRVQDGRLTALGEGAGVPPRELRGLAQAPDGTIWMVGVEGIASLAPGQWIAARRDAGLPERCVHAVVVDSKGAVWSATHAGPARWDGERWQIDANVPSREVKVDALWSDPDGTLWAGTRGAGLWRRSEQGWRTYGTKQGLPSDVISAIVRDRAGHLWVATRGGLAWLEGETFRRLLLPPTVCDDRIAAVTEDTEGGLWLGTERCGLHRLANRPFQLLTEAHGLPTSSIVGLASDGQGTIWLGTAGKGIVRVAEAGALAPRPVPCARDLDCEECWNFSAAPSSLWVTCTPRIAAAAVSGTMHPLTTLPAGMEAPDALLVAADGAAWVALDDKVVRVHAGVVTRIDQERLGGARVLYQGPSGTVWIGASDGVAAWRAGALTITVLPPGELPSDVTNLHEDEQGTLWIGTRGAGLRRLERGRLGTFGTAAGLPSSWVSQPLTDGKGRVWASARTGVFAVDRSELDDVADGRRARVSVVLYDAGDGIQMQTEAVGHPAGIKDRRGRLWFATETGVALFDPNAGLVPAPPVAIEQVRLGGRILGHVGGAARGKAGGDLQVAFRAISFGPPERLSFRYRLRGADADAEWVEAGPDRLARFSSLDPGRYELEIAARLREGRWTDRPTRLALTLAPPLHRSPWFLLGCAGAGGLALAFAHRMRVRRTRAALEAVLAERARIAREVHDTLAQAFVATSVQLECLDQALEEGDQTTARQHLATARTTVEESLDEARRSIWVLRPQALEKGLVPAIEALVTRLSSGEVNVRFEALGTPRRLPALVEASLLRIAQEALSNALRHARAREVKVHLEFLPRVTVLEVVDDGAGLEAAAPAGVHQGLVGMNERAAQAGGTLTIDSAPGKGTRVRFEVPV